MTSETMPRRFPRSSPYWPVLSHPLLRRILPGLTVSALGDGMAIVAVSWLALQLASPGQRGTWVAIAVAAYTLPSVVGTLVFGRWLGGFSGARLAGWDATLRATALAAIPLAYFGLTMLALGLGAPTGLSLLSFAVGGAIWAPYMPTSMALARRRLRRFPPPRAHH